MSELIKYKLTFPVQKVDFAESYPYPVVNVDTDNEKAIIPAPAQIRLLKEDTELTFSIGKIKSRTNPCVIYFKFYGYDYHKTLIAEHTSERMVVTTDYNLKYETFTIPYSTNPQTNKPYESGDLDHYYMELYIIGADSENPIYFNHLQLNKGEYTEYHKPNDEITNVLVGFNNNSYVNLYDETDTYLQVIRPFTEDITTEELTTSQMTILVPHLPYESTFDEPSAVFYEFMYMKEQRIGVEK